MKTMERDAVRSFLDERPGQFFTVVFIKRTTGEVRRMTCRTGVKKHLKGGDRAYNFETKNLLSVFDVQKADYRCIPLENVRGLEADGESYVVVD